MSETKAAFAERTIQSLITHFTVVWTTMDTGTFMN